MPNKIKKRIKDFYYKNICLCSKEGNIYVNPFKRFRRDFCEYNLKNLRLLSATVLLILFIILLGDAAGFLPITEHSYIIFMLVVVIFEIIIFVGSLIVEKKTYCPQVSSFAVYLNILVVYALFIYINITGLSYPAIALIVSLAGLQTLFIIPPIYSTLISGLAVAVFIILISIFKQNNYFSINIISSLSAYVIGFAVGISFTKSRIKQFHLIRENEELNRRLVKMTNTDPLTLISNRRRFNYQFEEIYIRCTNENKNLGFIMLDIDKFKLYNDNYGHVMGDNCLKKIGALFRSLTGETIKVYRYGGEEFAFVLINKSFKEVMDFAYTILEEINKLDIQHEFVGENGGHITVSIGVSYKNAECDKCQLQIINDADKGLYESKAKGGNAVTAVITGEINTENLEI